MSIKREEALKLLNQYIACESLKKHCLAVEAAMKFYAKKYGKNKKKWQITGLLHDLDYEKYPEDHPLKAAEILRERGYPEDIIEAILAHNQERTGVARKSLMAKCLYAVDELCGLLVAISLLRPDGFKGMSVKSVKKKLKDKSFAAKVSREDIIQGAKELGIDLENHIQTVILALKEWQF